MDDVRNCGVWADKNIKTASQWEKMKKVPIDAKGGVLLWVNGYHQEKARYFSEDEVRDMNKDELERVNSIHREKERIRRLRKKMLKIKSEAPSIEAIPCDNPSEIIAVDIIRTGTLDYEDDEILRISIVDGNKNILMNTYIKPLYAKEWKRTQTFGEYISSEMVADAPYLFEIIPQLKGIFESAKKVVNCEDDEDVLLLRFLLNDTGLLYFLDQKNIEFEDVLAESKELRTCRERVDSLYSARAILKCDAKESSDAFLDRVKSFISVSEAVTKEKQRIEEILLLNEQKKAEARKKKVIPCYNPSGIIVVDVETTGLDDCYDEILQISIIDGDKNVLMNTYIKPTFATEWKRAEAVNHISPEMVKDAPSIYDVIPQLKGIFESAKILVLYNASFDLNFIYSWTGIRRSDEQIVDDVMIDYAEHYGEWNDYFGNYKWQKLITACNEFGYEWEEDAHNSLGDVKATLFVRNELLKIKGNN